MESKRTSRKPLIFDGIEIIKSEKGSAEIEISMNITDNMINPNGILHGGMSYTLSDTCAGMGAYYLGYKVSTIQGNINYIRPETRGKVIGKNTLIHHGKRTIVSRVDIFNEENKIITSATFTMAILEKINLQ